MRGYSDSGESFVKEEELGKKHIAIRRIIKGKSLS